jgi:hypothetical protein
MGSIEAALAALALQNQPNYTATALQYNVDRTTLSRRHRGITRSRVDYIDELSLLTQYQQKTLVDYINVLTERGIPPTNTMVRTFAYDISGKWPGKNWVYRFVDAHNDVLQSGYLQGADMSRTKADNIRQYERFFEMVCGLILLHQYTKFIQLAKKISQYEVLPKNSYNMDEKGFLIGVLQKLKRVFNREYFASGKLLGAGQDGNREWVTILACICMDGTYLPPSVIYQALSGNIQDTWLQDFKPDEHTVHFSSSPSGWTSQEHGFEWLTGIFDRYTKQKARNGRDYRLLIVDGHSSHLNMKFLDWCDRHKILVCILPPHSTHRLQPLDVSLFAPLSTYYSQEVAGWVADTQGLTTMSKRSFFGLFWPAFTKAFVEENVMSGWAKTGLWPHDPSRVFSQIQIPQERSRRGTDSTSSTALSSSDWRKIRQLYRSIIGESLSVEARRLANTIDRLTTENALLKAENEGLRRGLTDEKKRRKRGKPLFYELASDEETKAIFFSPSKVQRARELYEAKEEEAKQAKLQKQERKIQKEIEREDKARLVKQRKIEREKARILREEEKAAKALARAEALQQRQVTQQLKNEQEQAKKNKRNTKPSTVPKVSNVVIIPDDEEVVQGNIQMARPRRQPRLPQHLDSYEL